MHTSLKSNGRGYPGGVSSCITPAHSRLRPHLGSRAKFTCPHTDGELLLIESTTPDKSRPFPRDVKLCSDSHYSHYFTCPHTDGELLLIESTTPDKSRPFPRDVKLCSDSHYSRYYANTTADRQTATTAQYTEALRCCSYYGVNTQHRRKEGRGPRVPSKCCRRGLRS